MLHEPSNSELLALQELAHRDLPRAVDLGMAAGRRAQAEAIAGIFGRLTRGVGRRLKGRHAPTCEAPYEARVPHGYGA